MKRRTFWEFSKKTINHIFVGLTMQGIVSLVCYVLAMQVILKYEGDEMLYGMYSRKYSRKRKE